MLRGERSLEFFNGQFLLVTRNGASEQFKFLSPEVVAAAFRNGPVDSGWLPPAVVRCGSTVQGDFAVLFIPARVHQLTIVTGKVERIVSLSVPLPSMLFFGIAKSFYVWAMKESQFKPTAQLFRCPTPNVFSNGSICWGSNRPPRASSATIAKAWDLFITSAFSDHAAEGKSRSHPKDVRGLLAKLRNKKKFPLAELMNAGGTAKTIIDNSIGGSHGD